VTVYQPVCTCAIDGIFGCALHEYTHGAGDEQHGWQTIDDLARLIAAGVQAYGDADAQRLARAYLEERT
jgi:hypothetical protein